LRAVSLVSGIVLSCSQKESKGGIKGNGQLYVHIPLYSHVPSMTLADADGLRCLPDASFGLMVLRKGVVVERMDVLSIKGKVFGLPFRALFTVLESGS
jgi:hypothetical protein